jgi:hypothetical protein
MSEFETNHGPKWEEGRFFTLDGESIGPDWKVSPSNDKSFAGSILGAVALGAAFDDSKIPVFLLVYPGLVWGSHNLAKEIEWHQLNEIFGAVGNKIIDTKPENTRVLSEEERLVLKHTSGIFKKAAVSWGGATLASLGAAFFHPVEGYAGVAATLPAYITFGKAWGRLRGVANGRSNFIDWPERKAEPEPEPEPEEAQETVNALPELAA